MKRLSFIPKSSSKVKKHNLACTCLQFGDLVVMLNSKDTVIHLVACLSGQCNLADAFTGVRQKYAVSSLFGRRPPPTTKTIHYKGHQAMEQSGVSFRETGEPWLLRPTKLHRNVLLQWDWLHDLLGRWKIGSFHFALPPWPQHHRLDRSTRQFGTCPVWLWGWSCCLGGCWSESLGMLNRNDIGKDIRISWISLSWNRQMLYILTGNLLFCWDLLIYWGRKWWRNMSNLFGAIRRGCSARVCCHEGPENQDDNGKSTIWRYISYWTSEFSIVMLVFREANGFDMRYWRFELSFYGEHLLRGLTFQGFFSLTWKKPRK